mgnify:FL=1
MSNIFYNKTKTEEEKLNKKMFDLLQVKKGMMNTSCNKKRKILGLQFCNITSELSLLSWSYLDEMKGVK